MDERATLTNMATECSARTAIAEADETTFEWLARRHPELSGDALRRAAVRPDPEAVYAGGVHTIDLAAMRPMVAHPGDPGRGVPSDPTNGAFVDEIGEVPIDIAYGGSCTAGKIDDLVFYHQVVREAADAGLREHGFLDTFARAGVRVIQPGCGACIGCGPGVSESRDQVTVSAINRNYKGRSGPGQLYLASPLTVAASAFTGRISSYRPGMFGRQAAAG